MTLFATPWLIVYMLLSLLNGVASKIEVFTGNIDLCLYMALSTVCFWAARFAAGGSLDGQIQWYSRLTEALGAARTCRAPVARQRLIPLSKEDLALAPSVRVTYVATPDWRRGY